MDKLQSYIQDVTVNVQTTQPQHNQLLRHRVKTHPIPFFGDVEHARVLTVGVNPSAHEFVKKRHWPEEMTITELTSRLQNYFLPGPVPPHKWFSTWSQALVPLGVSYQSGAAHLDLSPRATASMSSSSTDQEKFAEMIEQDAQWFFKLIPMCSEARLLIFAGCVTKWYMNDFVECIAAYHGFQFKGQATSKGEGRTGFYQLLGPGVTLPVFFCSISPSARSAEKRAVLIKRVEEHKERLSVLSHTQLNTAS